MLHGFSTITQKGQVSIPKTIRDYFGLKPFDKVRFNIQSGKIIAEPVLSLDDMLGIVASKKNLSKQDSKAIIRQQVLKKYADHS